MGHAPLFMAATARYKDTGTGERLNDHNVVAGGVLPLPKPFSDRQIILRTLWEKLDDDTYFLSQTPCIHRDFPLPENTVRTSNTRLAKLTRTGPSLTRFQGVGFMNLNGSVPVRINNAVTIPYMTKGPVSLVKYFASVRPIDAYNEGDAAALGQLLFLELYKYRKNEEMLREKISNLIAMMNVLRHAQAKYR